MELFADTYAFLAALDGSTAYRDVMAGATIRTTGPNVQEAAHALLRRGHTDLGAYLGPLLGTVVREPSGVPEAAARFRFQRQQAGRDCSTVDAWGYATAQALGIPFLTGDEDFRGVPGVKFVKA